MDFKKYTYNKNMYTIFNFNSDIKMVSIEKCKNSNVNSKRIRKLHIENKISVKKNYFA